MKYIEADFPYYTFENLNKHNIRHFVTSCRQGEQGDVNLRNPLGAENRRRLAKSVGFEIEKLTTGEQTHSLNIAIVDNTTAGSGNLTIESRISDTDALITNQQGVCLMVLTADCQSVLLYDAEKQAIAAIHAGWRGTANQIVAKTIAKMQQSFGTQPSNIVAAIGPSIGSCCFEVDEDVAIQFRHWPQAILRKPDWTKPHIDLTEANYQQLVEAGVNYINIEKSDVCTMCNPHEFFSHRYNKTLGRIGTGIVLV